MRVAAKAALFAMVMCATASFTLSYLSLVSWADSFYDGHVALKSSHAKMGYFLICSPIAALPLFPAFPRQL